MLAIRRAFHTVANVCKGSMVGNNRTCSRNGKEAIGPEHSLSSEVQLEAIEGFLSGKENRYDLCLKMITLAPLEKVN